MVDVVLEVEHVLMTMSAQNEMLLVSNALSPIKLLKV